MDESAGSGAGPRAIAEIVERVRAAAGGSGDDASLAARFAELVLRRVGGPHTDDPDALAGALLKAFAAADRRGAGQFDVRILDAGSTLLDGSKSEASVIEVGSEDRPFVIASISEELFRLGYRVVRIVSPVIGSRRGRTLGIVDVGSARTATHREAIVQVEIDSTLEPRRRELVVEAVRRVLDDVFRVTDDGSAMRDEVRDAAAQLDAAADDKGTDAADLSETAALLRWLLSRHFVLLGSCRFVAESAAGDSRVVIVDHGLGLLAEAGGRLRQPLTDHAEAPLLEVARTPEVSRVQRRAPVHRIDIALRHVEPPHVLRVVGVFSPDAENEPPGSIPVLRSKLARILESHDAVPGGYDEQALVSLFSILPRDELFTADVESLGHVLDVLLSSGGRQQVQVQVSPDAESRTVSVLVALPHDIYTGALRRRLQQHLVTQLDGGSADVDVSLGSRSEALVRFLIRLRDGMPMPRDPFDDIAHEVRVLCRTWDDQLELALADSTDRRTAARLARAYGPRFPAAYREMVDPEMAAADVAALRALQGEGDQIAVRFSRSVRRAPAARGMPPPSPDDPSEAASAGSRPAIARCRVYSAGAPVELSRFLPILESLGLWVVDEVPWTLGDGALYIHEFGVRAASRSKIDVSADGDRLAAAVQAMWSGWSEADSLNRLVLVAGLPIEDVRILRAYRRYRRQVTGRYSGAYVNDVLVAHPRVAHGLVNYFHARFGGASDGDEERVGAARAEVLAGCEVIARLDDDRILRGLLGTIEATMRTNWPGARDRALAIKLDSAAVPDLAPPVPYREIFVRGVDVEGIHLRFGPVARGGVRWSDRLDDYRTEVLDLARTQVLKNALIVPTGAKGGFVLRREPGGGQPTRAEVERAYETFVGGLLDLTDDVRGDEIIAVPRRRDADDPYLVVAADRGTADLSDVANALAERRNFWLGDAFASGGSHGYDHKALGVTARGAWAAVQRHFRALGIDIHSEPITVVGIGDLSGDVFGNGMLRSRSVKLVAAFDHRHVFCDPDPDPERSYRERERIAALDASSWDDYDRSVLSEGGGVWPRTAKRIELHPRAREALRIDADVVTPPELIRAILRAPVDLLFAGGIGTFVRASTEDDVGLDDRANSEVRVEATTVRARVVGEGANLAFTQRARIEYARHGGRVNIDAIDNSAGVDTSDHEVNLKILLRLALDKGELDDDERSRLLSASTDEVVAAVIDHVARHCDCLTLAQAASAADLDAYTSLLDELEAAGLVDRRLDALPDSDEVAARRAVGAGLTRPELAVLLLATKRRLRAAVLESSLPDAPAARPALVDYFPSSLAERLDHLLDRHRLRRELVATVVTNEIVDRLGIVFVRRLTGETGASAADVAAAAWVALRVAMGGGAFTAADEALAHWYDARDAPDPAPVLGSVLATLFGSLTRSYLLEGAPRDMTPLIERDVPVAADLMTVPEPGSSHDASHVHELELLGAPPRAATVLASLAQLETVPAAARLADEVGRPAGSVSAAFEPIVHRLGIDRLRRLVEAARAEGRWAHAAGQGLLVDLATIRDDATRAALLAHPDIDEHGAVDAWLASNRDAVADATRVRREVEADYDGGYHRLDGIAVAVRALRRVIG